MGVIRQHRHVIFIHSRLPVELHTIESHMNGTVLEALQPGNNEEYLAQLKTMSHHDMCMLVRFAPIGHPYFRKGTALNDAFYERFNRFGGMTPAMSKQIGYAV